MNQLAEWSGGPLCSAFKMKLTDKLNPSVHWRREKEGEVKKLATGACSLLDVSDSDWPQSGVTKFMQVNNGVFLFSFVSYKKTLPANTPYM